MAVRGTNPLILLQGRTPSAQPAINTFFNARQSGNQNRLSKLQIADDTRQLGISTLTQAAKLFVPQIESGDIAGARATIKRARRVAETSGVPGLTDDFDDMLNNIGTKTESVARFGRQILQAFPQTGQSQGKRQIAKDVSGFQRDVQTGERLFPDAVQGADSKVEQTRFKNAKDLRSSFLKQSKPFIDTRDSYNRIIASSSDPSAAGDLALIFNYMKVLDPGSTVREGEFATAQNTGSVEQRVWSVYNRVVSGERLTAVQREDFVDRAGRLFRQQQASHKKRVSEFSRISGRFGLEAQDVIMDLTREDVQQNQEGEQNQIGRFKIEVIE